MPDGFRVVRMAPGADALDPTKEASKALLDKFILLRFENFGWCKGTIIKRVTNRRRSIGGVHVNFMAKFDIDDGPTDLSLELTEYDLSPSAAYESWLLLEPDEP